MAGCLQAVNQQTIAAIGKSKVFFVWTIVKQSLAIVLQVGGLIVWGMWGLLIGKVISSWFSYFVNISLVSKHLGYKNHQQLKDLAPIFLVSLLAAVICYLMGDLLDLNMHLEAVIQTLVFIIIYLSWSLIFKPESYTYTLSVLGVLKNKTNKKHAK